MPETLESREVEPQNLRGLVDNIFSEPNGYAELARGAYARLNAPKGERFVNEDGNQSAIDKGTVNSAPSNILQEGVVAIKDFAMEKNIPEEQVKEAIVYLNTRVEGLKKEIGI